MPFTNEDGYVPEKKKGRKRTDTIIFHVSHPNADAGPPAGACVTEYADSVEKERETDGRGQQLNGKDEREECGCVERRPSHMYGRH